MQPLLEHIGEVIRNDRLFESFRYQFEVPADGDGEMLPLVFQRYLRPGEVELRLKIEDLYGRRYAHVDQAFEVPDVGGAEAPDLLSVLREDSEPPVRRAAAKALGRLGDPRAIPALLDALVVGGRSRRALRPYQLLTAILLLVALAPELDGRYSSVISVLYGTVTQGRPSPTVLASPDSRASTSPVTDWIWSCHIGAENTAPSKSSRLWVAGFRKLSHTPGPVFHLI